LLPERRQDTVIDDPRIFSREDLWKESASLITRGFYAIENNEEPVVYLAKADSMQLEERKPYHKKKTKIAGKHSKSKLKAKKYLAKKSKKQKKYLAKKSGKKKAVLTAKKKGKKTLHAKRKAGKKNCRVAKKRRLNGIKDKKVTVVGLARSGRRCNMLAELRAQVIDRHKAGRGASGMFGGPPAVRRFLGAHPAEIFLHADMLVVSPGVPLDIGPLLQGPKSR
jgi:hypothetical protein